MRKQVIAAILSAGMVVSMTACGAGASSDAAGTTAAEAASEDTSTETTQAAADAEPAETDTTTEAAESTTAETNDSAETTDDDDTIMLVQSTFVEERAGKDEFDSFDEIINQLEEGEGYAYIDIAGYDGSDYGQILAVTDGTYGWDDDTSAAISVCLYAACGYMEGGYAGGKPVNIGDVQTGGTAYPIRLSEDGQLYVCNNRTYGILQVSDADLLYYTKKIDITYAEDGTAAVSGFTSENGEMTTANHDIGITTEDEFYALYDGLDDIPPINFTVVGAE